MSSTLQRRWEHLRTPESRLVEDVLKGHFGQVDAYRYNSASLRLRVIDPSFEGKSREERDTIVESKLPLLPLETQQDIINLVTLAPSYPQEQADIGDLLMNLEFDDPSPNRF